MISLCAFEGMHAGVCAQTKRATVEGDWEQWGGRRAGTGTSLMPVWLDVDGRVGSGERGLTKRGRCFSQQAGSSDRKGPGCVPHHYTLHWLLIALFDPFYPQPSETGFSTRGRSVFLPSVFILWQGPSKSFQAVADNSHAMFSPQCSLLWISCWYARQLLGHTQHNRAGGWNEKMKPFLIELAAIWCACVCSVLYLLLRNAMWF